MKWLAKRCASFEASGIRKVFDLGAKLENPINLSIGQPDFDVPPAIRAAMHAAIGERKNGYTPTQGAAPLLEKINADLQSVYGHNDRRAFLTSGTSGGLVLALWASVDPGDEVVFFDPYFVMYDALVKMIGGVPVTVDLTNNFRIDIQKLADAITPKTKVILFNSPANPTGFVASREEVRAVAELAKERDILLVSDEIYSRFCYDAPFVSPARFNDCTLVLDGYSKTYAMTGWRVGVAHGPAELIEQMLKFQQYTFVCAPQVGQWGVLAAHDVDMTPYIDDYRRKRNKLRDGIADLYEVSGGEGAFYLFPKVPHEGVSATEFVHRGIEQFSLLTIPGNVFSRHDTHFRLSYAASDATLDRGIEALRALAKG
ncbi:MAG: pyridoxal phosphate-dependent aminotransferase [Thermoguttaceae bacterium]